MIRRYHGLVLGAACFIFLTCAPAAAGEFSVNPVRVELGPKAKSASVTVANDGKEKISFQLQAMDWSQDSGGKDQYSETSELIFFPKIMSVEPGEEGIIRVGLKARAAPDERTFRLFIEELPGAAKKPEGNAAQINFLIRFGLPIFAAPIQPQDALVIERLALKGGVVTITAKNNGNRHQVYETLHVEGTDAAGKRVFGRDIADRYLLAGTTKSYTTTLTAEECRKVAVLGIEIKTDRITQARTLDVNPTMCP